MENWAETQMLIWNSQWGKKAYFSIAPLLRKLSTMLCRHFHHVSPRTVISSAPAVPSSWSSGGWQGFPTRCEDPHQPPAPQMPYQALLADAGSHDLSNLWWGAVSSCMTPSSCLPCKDPSAVLARCEVRAFLGSLMSLGWDFHVPLSAGLLAACISCTGTCWAKALGPGEFRLFGQKSCISSRSLLC